MDIYTSLLLDIYFSVIQKKKKRIIY